MGEAIVVDGSGSPPPAQIIFSAIDKDTVDAVFYLNWRILQAM